ncbi:MAG: hypothetical protein F4Y61_05585 [Rhodothermaceae bacterium]|nr:hypothetical protein [Rhodothermaceae bacterium]
MEADLVSSAESTAVDAVTHRLPRRAAPGAGLPAPMDQVALTAGRAHTPAGHPMLVRRQQIGRRAPVGVGAVLITGRENHARGLGGAGRLDVCRGIGGAGTRRGQQGHSDGYGGGSGHSATLQALSPSKWIGLRCGLGSWPPSDSPPAALSALPEYRIWDTVRLVTVLLVFAVLVLGAILRFRHGKRTGNRVRLTRGFWLKVLLGFGMLQLIIWLEPGGPWTLVVMGLLLGLGLLEERSKRSKSISDGSGEIQS